MKKILYLFTSAFLLLQSCTEKSPLSDVELTDASIIYPEIWINKSIDENNQHNDQISLFLYDNNRNSIELKKGDIKVNGHQLKVQNTLINKAPFYVFNKTIETNKEYNFEITLSDGEIYKASVKTDKEFTPLVVPETYEQGNDLIIQWKPCFQADEIELEVKQYFVEDSTQESNTASLSLAIPQNATSYTISKNVLEQNRKVTKLLLTFSTRKKGKIDTRFDANRKIEYSYSVSKQIIVR